MDSLKKFGMNVGMGMGVGLCALMIAAGRPESVVVLAPEGEEIAGDFNQPLAEGKNSDSTTNITVVDDGVTYSAKLDGNKIKSVQKDGKELNKNQYRMKGGKIEILDEDGDVEKSLSLPRAARSARVRMNAMAPLARLAPGTPAAPGAPTPPPTPRAFVVGKQPKVMLGVTMSDADSDVMEQLGVEDGEGVVLDSVMKELPAGRAGLKANDIILEADGKKLSGQEQFRQVLATKSPGDVMVVKVLRKGGPQEMKITLDAFNPSKLQTVTIKRDSDATSSGMDIDAEQLQEILKQVEGQVREQMQALKSQLDSTDWNKVRDQVSAALGESMAKLAEARAQAAAAGAEGMKWWQEHGHEFSMPEGWMQFTQPTPYPAGQGQQVSPEMGGKLDKLSEQLERMNKRLDEMEKQIQKK